VHSYVSLVSLSEMKDKPSLNASPMEYSSTASNRSWRTSQQTKPSATGHDGFAQGHLEAAPNISDLSHSAFSWLRVDQ